MQASIRASELESQMSDLSLDDEFDAFSATLTSQLEDLTRIETEIRSAQEQIQAVSASLAANRLAVSDHLSDAMLASSAAGGRNLFVNTVLRSRFTTNQERYRRAREHAIRMAYLARIAIEQRLGMRLADMKEDLWLVEAPASWESDLCTLSGFDYQDVRDGSFDTGYADEYVGEYVDRLQRVVEGYRRQYPFHEGTDTAVVSLRNDVLQTRAPCAPGTSVVPNLLAESDRVRVRMLNSAEVQQPQSTWYTDSAECTPVVWGGAGDARVAGCVGAIRAAGLPSIVPSTPGAEDATAPTPWRITFGGSAIQSSTYPSGHTANTSIRQDVEVASGRYWVSWYGFKEAPPSGSTELRPDPSSVVRVSVDGVPQLLSPVATLIGAGGSNACQPNVAAPPSGAGVWCRYHAQLALQSPSLVTLAIVPTTVGSSVVESTVLAGFQLERTTAANQSAPGLFAATTSAGRGDASTCEDVDGAVFRQDWRYSCLRLCRTGFGTSCAEADADLYCFYERDFNVSRSDLEMQGRLVNSGFAVGNFNYRVDRLGFNIVGSAVRDCTNAWSPSTCYASGYLNVSLIHQGPFTVTNHLGSEFAAPLYDGLIEYTRALNAERFITNPISTADRSLIDPYMREEFKGRPLTGTYTLRIWDDGNIDFSRIEDVQLVLDYRYWTRFQ